MGEYSPTPKPRRGHRRASGGGASAGEEPRIAGVNAPLHIHARQQPPRGEFSAASAAELPQFSERSRAQNSAQNHITDEERARLEWMREQKPPHWG